MDISLVLIPTPSTTRWWWWSDFGRTG